MESSLLIRELLNRYTDLKNYIILFDDQFYFNEKYTLEEWNRKVEFFLQDSDEVIRQHSQQDTEFKAFQYRFCDDIINSKNIDDFHSIDRKKRKDEEELQGDDDFELPCIEKPYGKCLKKIQEMNERAELLKWLQKKCQSCTSYKAPSILLSDKYGDFTFKMDEKHMPISVSYAGKVLNITKSRLIFFWEIMQRCYNSNESVSFDTLTRVLPNKPSDKTLRKYQSEVNDKLKQALKTQKLYIVTVGKSNPRHFRLEF